MFFYKKKFIKNTKIIKFNIFLKKLISIFFIYLNVIKYVLNMCISSLNIKLILGIEPKLVDNESTLKPFN